MHKLYEFACDELKELERKADEKGLSAAELEYAGKLTELKKNILKIEMLEDEGYSADEMHNRSYRNSYARRRDSMGRYSRNYPRYSMDSKEFIEELEEMKVSAPDEMSRKEISKLIERMR